MNSVVPVSIVVEGQSDVAVVERILAMVECSVGAVYGRKGKADVDRSLPGYNNAARFAPWIALRDLDADAPCAPQLARAILPHPSPWMRFRIAVREMESWLLADPEALSTYLKVSRALIPGQPQTLPDPKQALVNLARRSRIASMRGDMVPEPGVSATVGPGYVYRIMDFAGNHWRPEVARQSSASLNRCIERAAELRTYV